MIKIISSKELENGGYEMILMLTLFHVEPTTIFKIIRNSSKYEVENEARNERSQVVVSAVGKYISLEESNGLTKDLLETEAIDRLTKLYNHMQDNRYNIESHCQMMLKMKPIFKRIARPGNQYIYFNVIMQMAEEQLEYEKSKETI